MVLIDQRVCKLIKLAGVPAVIEAVGEHEIATVDAAFASTMSKYALTPGTRDSKSAAIGPERVEIAPTSIWVGVTPGALVVAPVPMHETAASNHQEQRRRDCPRAAQPSKMHPVRSNSHMSPRFR